MRLPIRAALAAAALMLGLAAAARAEPPTQVTITQGVVTLAAATDAPLTVNAFDKTICLMNIGTHDATLAFNGAAAVAGQGWDLSAPGTAGTSNTKCWDAGTVPLGIIHGISTSGTTIAVLEGR